MAGLLDLRSIKQFSVPLGRVMLQYSNFDAALTEFLVRALGFEDWRECDEQAGPDVPLGNRLKLFWSLHGQNAQRTPWPSAKSLILEAKPAIEKRHVMVHGQWWLEPQTNEVMTRYFQKSADQPEHQSWTSTDVLNVARTLEIAAGELEAFGYQLREGNGIAERNG